MAREATTTARGTFDRADGNASVEARATASEGPSCEQCGVPLRGRKERFCSDRCRMRLRRETTVNRRHELVRQLREAVMAVEAELLNRSGE